MRRVFIYAMLVMLIGCRVSAAEFSKVGTSMAQFLKLPAGARGAALGGAYAAATEDVYSMAWNPAGLGHVRQFTFGGSYLNYFADINFSYIGVAMPVDRVSTFGLHAHFVGTDPIEITTIEQPNGTGTFYDYRGLVLGGSYARWLTDRLTIGVNVKLVREVIYREEAGTFAFDIGSQFDTGLHGIRLAMCVANFGGKMRLDGPDLNTETDTDSELQGDRTTESQLKTIEWPLPMIFRMGVMMDMLGGTNDIIPNESNRITLVADANDPIDHILRYNVGAEYAWQEMFALRAGYHFNYDKDTLGLTLGAGVKLETGGTNISIDYAFQDFGILDAIHHYTLSLDF